MPKKITKKEAEFEARKRCSRCRMDCQVKNVRGVCKGFERKGDVRP